MSPRVVLVETAASNVTLRNMPGLSADSAALAGVLSAAVTGEPSDLVILLLGLPGAPVVVNGVVGELWLDPAAFQFWAVGVQPAVGPFAATLAVPNVSALRLPCSVGL